MSRYDFCVIVLDPAKVIADKKAILNANTGANGKPVSLTSIKEKKLPEGASNEFQSAKDFASAE